MKGLPYILLRLAQGHNRISFELWLKNLAELFCLFHHSPQIHPDGHPLESSCHRMIQRSLQNVEAALSSSVGKAGNLKASKIVHCLQL